MMKFAFRIITISFLCYCLIHPFINQEQKAPKQLPPVVAIEKKPVKELPLHSVSLPNFAGIKSTKQKKQTFFELLKPYVLEQNEKIAQERQIIDDVLTAFELEMPVTQRMREKALGIITKYKIQPKLTEDNLLLALNRVDQLPTGLVLAQAANESGWGTSRFTRIGLNFFGQWCYKKGCGLVPKNRDVDGNHEVAAFKSIEDGVASYFLNVNTHRAYQALRDIRAEHRGSQSIDEMALLLAQGLMSYSQRGEAYIDEISQMIVSNQGYFSD